MEANNSKNVDEVKKKGKALLIYDLKQRKLIPTKVLFFVVLSSKCYTSLAAQLLHCYVWSDVAKKDRGRMKP